MESLFRKYPAIFYSNTACLDLTRRVTISQVTRGPYLFYPLVLKAGIRIDTLADAYYSDPYLEWLILLGNDIVDPYYQWYLDENEFNEYIRDKYGSHEFAIEKTKFWRVNWGESEAEISPTYYENTLPADWKRYYSPIYGSGSKITTYRRKQEDWFVATNEILQYELTYTVGNSFSNGEILDLKFSGAPTGGAEAIVSNSSMIMVQHTQGNTVANTTHVVTIVGETSLTEATTDEVTTLAAVVTNSDSKFWSRVSFFDWENEQNEMRKHLKILDKRFALDTAEGVRLKLLE